MSLVGAFLPYISKAQIDQLQMKNTSLGFFHSTPTIIFLVLLAVPFLIEFFRVAVLNNLDNRIVLKITFSALHHIRELVWEKFKQMDGSFFENQASRRIISMVIRSDNIIRDSLGIFSRVTNSLILVLVAIPVLGQVGWQLVAITFFTVLISTLISTYDQKREAVFQLLRDKSFDDFSQIDSLLTYRYKDARALGAVDSLEKKFKKILDSQYQIEKKGKIQSDQFRSADSVLTGLLTVATSLIAGLWVLSGSYTLGTYTLVVAYTFQLSRSFRDIAGLMRTSMEMDLRISQLKFFLSLKPRLIFSENLKENIPNPQSVALINAHFAYAGYGSEEKAYLEMIMDRSKKFLARFGHNGMGWQLRALIEEMGKIEKPTEVLKGVSIELKKGEVLALLGRNGVGKTTITNILMHNYELGSGTVQIDGIPVNNFEHQNLLQQFSVIQQYPIIITGFSIRDNLVIGTIENISDDKIWEQLKIVGLADKIKELPKGLDTLMGDEINLSGGQNQLLVIARVFLQKRPFIIFDEGMSNLDAEHEMKIVKLLKSQSKHSGILFITHRITAARHADRIIVLDQGKVSQEGTHASLVNKRGIYKHFWDLQVVS